MLGWLVWFLVEVMLTYTGKSVVVVVSFGQWRGDNTRKKESKIYSGAGSLSFKYDGQHVVTANGLLFAGILFYVALAIFSLFLASRS